MEYSSAECLNQAVCLSFRGYFQTPTHRGGRIPSQISQLWQSGSRGWSLARSRAWRGAVLMWGRSWPREGRGMSTRPDGNGDEERWRKGGEGTQCGAGASRPQPAHGWGGRMLYKRNRGKVQAMPLKYNPYWKINEHHMAWAPCRTTQITVVISFNNPDCVFCRCRWLSLGAGRAAVKSGHLRGAGGAAGATAWPAWPGSRVWRETAVILANTERGGQDR